MLISIRGLYKWDPSIFDGFHVPVGMNKLHAVADILFNCAELSVVYPDPNFMAEAIALWSDIELANWERAWNALQLEYNPIWNVDATIREAEERNLEGTEGREYRREAESGESFTRDLTRGVEFAENGTNNNTRTQTNTETLNTTRTDDLAENEQTVNSVSGFNAITSTESDRQTRNKTNTGTVKDTGTIGNNGTITDAGTTTNENSTDESIEEQTTKDASENLVDTESKNMTDQGTITRDIRRTGNIGVTTSQEMLRQELEIAEANVYKTITSSFKRRFCIQVY